jgi:hypothetical protein
MSCREEQASSARPNVRFQISVCGATLPSGLTLSSDSYGLSNSISQTHRKTSVDFFFPSSRLLSVIPIESGELATDGSQVHHLPSLLSTASSPIRENTSPLNVNPSPSPNARAKFRKRSRSQVEVDLNGSDPMVAIAPLQYLEGPSFFNSPRCW